MPKRKVIQTVVVHREGQRVVPPIGQIFDFTAAELDYINQLNPSAVAKIEAPTKEFVVDGAAGTDTAADADADGAADTGTDADADTGDKSASTALAVTGRRGGRQAAAADGDI